MKCNFKISYVLIVHNDTKLPYFRLVETVELEAVFLDNIISVDIYNPGWYLSWHVLPVSVVHDLACVLQH